MSRSGALQTVKCWAPPGVGDHRCCLGLSGGVTVSFSLSVSCVGLSGGVTVSFSLSVSCVGLTGGVTVSFCLSAV